MHADSLARRIDAAMPAAPLRKAALLLHSMCEADRRWMLGRVDEAQRTRLDELLGELRALDFPRDPALLREALQPVPQVAPRATAAGRAPAQWSVEDAVRLFDAEPDAVIAIALFAADVGSHWPWEPGLLRRLGSVRANAVMACRERLSARPLPQALVDAVLAASRARCDSPDTRGATAGRSTP